jgi:hypothetical protein
MQNGDRAFLAILILAAAAWLVFECVRPTRASRTGNATPPTIDLRAVDVTEQPPNTDYVAAPPLMAMLPTQAV